MKRRNFLSAAAIGAVGASMRSGAVAAQERGSATISPPDDASIDPYFLDAGEISVSEQRAIADYEQYRELRQRGQDAVMPRGGRPGRAPTYRFLHWSGDLDDPGARFVGPLSAKPAYEALSACELNAQILGFRASSEDFKGKAERGTLTVELRARTDGESLTWLYARQFDLFEGGVSNLGMEHVAQRDGAAAPVFMDEPNLDIRIQLMRHPGRGGFLRKILKVATVVTGLPLGPGVGGRAQAVQDALPAIAVPHLAREGVALTQAMFGGTAEEKPIWCSGFNSFSLTTGGGRLKLVPGIWVAIDESRQVDMRGVRVADVGGRVALTRDGELIDANYLILDIQMDDGGQAIKTGEAYRGVIPKGD